MIERFQKVGAALHSIPNDAWAILVLLHGAVLVALGHKEEGQLIIGGALAIFRGESKPKDDSSG